jgi:flavin-dependent dehydrogenase
MQIVVIGAGAAGLSAGLGLARNGHSVTILERDPAPEDMDIEQAWCDWRRKGVPQIRQGHFVLGRAQDMLTSHAPDVIDGLAEQGIVPPANPLLFIVSEDELQPGDEFLRPLPTRRIPFELTMRRVAELQAGIEIRSGAKATGLLVDNGNGLPRVLGVGLEDGSELRADFVIDAGGNKSPIGRWLREAGATLPPEQKQESGVTYFNRYFRAKGEAPDPWALVQASGGTPYLEYVVFPGDRGTYGVCFFVPAWDMHLRALRDTSAYMAAAKFFPSIAPWVDKDSAEPIGEVDVAASHDNVLRPFLADGLPGYLGSLPVGDALGTTDARRGWGLSFALTHGFAAATAISEHPNDPGDAALAYADVVMAELEEYVRFAAAFSRISIRGWRGEPLDPQDADEERAAAVSAVTLDKLFSDPALLRAGLRNANLTDPPSVLFQNSDFVRKVKEIAQERSATSSDALSRDELVGSLSSGGVPSSRVAG